MRFNSREKLWVYELEKRPGILVCQLHQAFQNLETVTKTNYGEMSISTWKTNWIEFKRIQSFYLKISSLLFLSNTKNITISMIKQ